MKYINYIIGKIVKHPYAILLLCWYGFLRWYLLPVTNAESILWGKNQFGAFMAIVSAVYLIYYISRDIPKGVYSGVWLVTTLGLGAFNVWCLYGMTGIYLRDMSIINFMYECLDISILTFYILMIVKCAMTIQNTVCDCIDNKIKFLGV